MLRDLNRIGIREELPKAGLKLTPEAVPKLQGVEFYLTSFLDTQRAADATNRPVTFIAADQPTITGDKATLRLGLDVSTAVEDAFARALALRPDARPSMSHLWAALR